LPKRSAGPHLPHQQGSKPALVVFLRGVNVGGHRTFRPSLLAAQLKHLDAVSIGAAGTFVIRRPVGLARLRDEFARRLPFETNIMICEGRDIVRLMSRDFFRDDRVRHSVVRFVSVLSQAPRSAPSTPVNLPPAGKWLVRILARDRRFVVGMYRRQMQAIRYLGTLDRVFGAPVTTRNWNTMLAIAEVLDKQTR
jgi:uncharacterized protein (DUF1697 family)